jgi:hypothetical protein
MVGEKADRDEDHDRDGVGGRERARRDSRCRTEPHALRLAASRRRAVFLLHAGVWRNWHTDVTIHPRSPDSLDGIRGGRWVSQKKQQGFDPRELDSRPNE